MKSTDIDLLVASFLKNDSYLKPFQKKIYDRIRKIRDLTRRIASGKGDLHSFSGAHTYFGLHFERDHWVFRELAPNATAIFLTGDMTGWKEHEDYALKRIDAKGIWEIVMPEDSLIHGALFRLKMYWNNGEGDRIPSYARRVVQDPATLIFNAQVWKPSHEYTWKNEDFRLTGNPPYIYEAHIGMAQDKEGVGTFSEFRQNILPRIAGSGYTVLQLMGIQEHPYYGSFGYHVSSFFAVSSRFGTPEDFKELVDSAHGLGIAVIMDIVHSHAVNNEVEGISRFDGTLYQYFHDNPRGYHHAWDSRCFDYSKEITLQFLLSNCRYWMEEYHLDGFRFDGITSMLYLHHGLSHAFTSYDQYYNEDVDEDALAYLALANQVIHEIRPEALTIAEDISGMPGLAVSSEKGGIGFDYRLAMGVPDLWIKLTKEMRDEDWPLRHLWFELTNRRWDEKTIGYAESHDQALVGDKTLMFRLMDADMYTGMHIQVDNFRVDRGMALHRLIRLITLATAGNGYLNFMGNEFGHPEWIDFPREGNNWSYQYARRQWHLVDNPELKYRFLADFDEKMISMTKQYKLHSEPRIDLIYEHSDDKVIIFSRNSILFAFNFHPTRSYPDYSFEIQKGKYEMILDSDAKQFGGQGRLKPGQIHETFAMDDGNRRRFVLSLYLPTRTALVLRQVRNGS
jgi:1,4-alpha-glucan branching enzyme